MWPKLIAQLVELLPHIARLIPLADTFLASRAISDGASEAAVAALSEDVRKDLGKVAASHESLYRQLQDQGQKIDDVRESLTETQVLIATCSEHTAALERQVASINLWLKIVGALVVVAIGLLIAVLVKL